MEIYLCIFGILTVIYGLASAANQGTGGEAGYKLLDETDDGRLGNLTCFSCYYSVHGNHCLTLEDKNRKELVQRCQPGEYFCKVKRFMSDNKMETFERSCTSKCTPGCETFDSAFPLQTCHSCCRSDLCNTDNAATRIYKASFLLLFSSFTCFYTTFFVPSG